MEVEKIEDGDNIVLKVTREVFHQVAKHDEEEVKMAMVDYAKKNNTELRLLDEDEVKIIIDLGCKEYLKGHNSGYISKDKIRDLQIQREFELQQMYADFEFDIEWKVYEKLLKE